MIDYVSLTVCETIADTVVLKTLSVGTLRSLTLQTSVVPNMMRMTMLIASIATFTIVELAPPTRYRHTRDRLTNKHDNDETCRHCVLSTTSALLPATTDTNRLGMSSVVRKNVADSTLVHSTMNFSMYLIVLWPLVF